MGGGGALLFLVCLFYILFSGFLLLSHLMPFLKSISVKFPPLSSIFSDLFFFFFDWADIFAKYFLFCPFQPFNLPPALPVILFLCPFVPLSLLLLSLSLSSLCGCTWYSLACLSSRRLDSSNLLREPRVLVRIIHCTKPDLAALKPPLFSAAFFLFFFFLPPSCGSVISVRSGHVLPSSSVLLACLARTLRQPPQSAG